MFNSEWESKHGSLEGLCVLVQQQACDTDGVWERLRKSCVTLLTDPEARVRQAAGENFQYCSRAFVCIVIL